MIELYDEQVFEVCSIVGTVNEKWLERPDTLENLNELQKELEGKLYDAGYIARVEVATFPASVVIDGLVKPEEFDHDRKGWEIAKSRAEGGR